MPYKDVKKRRTNARRYKARRRAGLPTAAVALTPTERAERKRTSWQRWAAANPDKVKASRDRFNRLGADAKRDHNLRKRYNITLADQRVMIAKQDGLCPLCGEALDLSRPRSLHTDHDHETDRVRGIVHGSCNMALGKFGDGAPGLERALRYVRGDIELVIGLSAGLLF